MGWEDRPYYRDGAPSNRVLAFLSSSLPLYTAWGIRVRAHISLPIFIVVDLILNWSYPLEARLTAMTFLFASVLLHEYGHCIVARGVGGDAREILLWPLGGFAYPDLPREPLPHFLTSLGGVAVNLTLCLFSALAVWVLTAHRVAVTLNPFYMAAPYELTWRSLAFYCWYLYAVNYALLLYNLLPIYPLDGGQAIQAILWKPLGYMRSMRVSILIGFFGCGAMVLVGFALRQPSVWIVGLVFLFMLVQRRQQLKEMAGDEPWSMEFPDFSQSLREAPPVRRSRKSRKALMTAKRLARQETEHRQKIDQILAKVSAEGMASLTRGERKFLHLATQAQRQIDHELRGIMEE